MTKKKNMTVFIEKNRYDHLKKLSFKLTFEEGEKIGLSEIVRRALVEMWPMECDNGIDTKTPK